MIFLAAWSIAAGLVLSLAFRRFANIDAIRVQRRLLWAHVISLHLYGEEPALALRGLLEILRCNLRLLGYTLVPLAIAAPLAVPIALHLDRYFDSTPLTTGHPGVLTVALRAPLDAKAAAHLELPGWVRADSPPVHIVASNEISWRVRAIGEGHGVARVSVSGETVTRQVDARRSPVAWTEWAAAIAGIAAWGAWLALDRLVMDRLLLLFQAL